MGGLVAPRNLVRQALGKWVLFDESLWRNDFALFLAILRFFKHEHICVAFCKQVVILVDLKVLII